MNDYPLLVWQMETSLLVPARSALAACLAQTARPVTWQPARCALIIRSGHYCCAPVPRARVRPRQVEEGRSDELTDLTSPRR